MTEPMRSLTIAVLTSTTFTGTVVTATAIILQSWQILLAGLLAIAIAVVAIPIIIGIAALFDRLLGGSR